MRLKALFTERYSVVAVLDGDICPAEDFLTSGEEATRASREGFLMFLQFIAENGFDKAPVSWSHEANKKNGIYEFRKGKLRLFFFKGLNGQIAVCTTGVRKTTAKANKSAVKLAIEYKNNYFAAAKNEELVLIQEDENK